MSKDRTWKRKIGEKDQIIALITKAAKLQTKLDKQVAAFAIQAKNCNTSNSEPDTNCGGGTCCGKKDEPYTVMEWILTKKEDTVTANGTMYHLCTGDQYSGGTKHNGIYADHNSCNHKAWQAHIDADHNAHCSTCTKRNSPAVVPKPTDAPTQKLALNVISFALHFAHRWVSLMKPPT
jgi:hypothetical protein